MPEIHPSSLVDPKAQLHESVRIGPFCTITGDVRLAANVQLLSHVCLYGPLTVGARTTIYPGTCLGLPPQDVKFKLGDVTAGIVVGEDCILREHVTIHSASKSDIPTTIGNNIFMMASSHVGHDAHVHDNVILVNCALLGGHSAIFAGATLGGLAAIHQFCRVGRLAFVGGLSAVTRDIPPFCLSALRGTMQSVNLVGMRRAGVPREHITAVRRAFWHVLRANLPRKETITELEARGKDCPLIIEMAEFVATAKRPIARGIGGHSDQAAGED